MADKSAKRTTKTIYRTESPFPKPQVSKLEQPYHDVVAELLVNVLRPIGIYRSTIPKSKGKRGKKRKRKTEQPDQGATATIDNQSEGSVIAPPACDLVVIGFNAVTRHLEKLNSESRKAHSDRSSDSAIVDLRHPSAVFLLRPLDDLIYSHLPTLCQTSSLARPELPATRLVLLDPAIEEQVTTALGQSNSASVLAILDGSKDVPGLNALRECVTEHAEPVNVPWLRELTGGRWFGTKIDAHQTT